MSFRLHWFVGYDGMAPCGAGTAPSVAVPARSVVDVDCKRCLALPEFQGVLREERARLDVARSLGKKLGKRLG